MRYLLLILCLAVAALGCKKGPVTKLTAVPPAQAPQGWTVHDMTKEGFSIAAPANFRTNPGTGIDLVAPTPSESYGLESMGQSPSEQIEETRRELSDDAKAKGFVLILYDRGTRPIPGEERTMIQVKKEVTGGANLKDAAEELKADLGEVKSNETLKMPYGEVVEMVKEFRTIGGDEVREIHYVIVNDTDVYRIRMNTTNQAGVFDSIAREVVATFRDK